MSAKKPAAKKSAKQTSSRTNLTRRDFIRKASLIVPLLALGGVGVTFGATTLYDDLIRTTWDFTDDLGRTVAIPTPSHLHKIYFNGPAGQILLFSLRPDLIGGTTLQFTKQELEFLPTGTSNLPYMGSMIDDGSIDTGALQQEGIQLILSVGTDDDSFTQIANPEELQDETGIPVVYLKGGFDDMGSAYRKLGIIIDEQPRAEELASYCEGLYGGVRKAVASIPVEERVTIYYAEGPEGLQTEPFTSAHAYTFAVAGAYNVADVKTLTERGMTSVTLSQIRKWDPEVIIAWDKTIRNGADQLIRKSPAWKGIKAVDNQRVYTMPNTPYSWCDRPACVNRLIGVQWVANMLYPKAYEIDMIDAVKSFYNIMWHLSISDDQAKSLLGNSYPPYGTK